MKIVYCTNAIHTVGGAERVLANKVNFLVSHNFDVSIVVWSPTKTPFYFIDPRVKVYSVDCELDIRGVFGKMRKYKAKSKYLNEMNALMNEIKPEIVVSMADRYSRYIYKLKDGSKKIVERHISKYKDKYYYTRYDDSFLGRIYTHYFHKYSDYKIYSQFDKFIVLTEEDKKSWGTMPNILAIPNALSSVPVSKAKLVNKRVIAAGRIVAQKQFHKLIEIWSKIARKYPDWKLTIFGDGDRESLYELIRQYNITDFVEVKPTTKDIEKEYLNSSIYALSSTHEGFPMVLLEAMTYGLPVVSYACKCGPRDMIVDDEDGFLIEFGDMDKFAEKLSLLIENEEMRQRMGKAASENILRFSEDVVMAKWIKLFNELASQS